MSKIKNKSPKTIKTYLMIVTGVFLVVIIVYTDILFSLRRANDDILSSFRNQKFETIVSCIDELNDEAYNSAKLVSENIEKAIKSSVDMGELKQELDNQEQPDYYCDILERETKNVSLNRVKNTRNGILILNNSGIVFDNNYERMSSAPERLERTYENERNWQYNKPLFDTAIKSIFAKTKGNIAIESISMSEYNDHYKIPNASFSQLKRIYKEEGLEGLESYQFLVPAYITDDGDIFGQKDVVKGVIRRNHKLVVIQEYNLYDQITAKFPELINDTSEEEILVNHGNSLNLSYVLGSILIASYLIIMIILVNAYNCAIEEN